MVTGVGMFRQAVHGVGTLGTAGRPFHSIFTINLIANNDNVYFNV